MLRNSVRRLASVQSTTRLLKSLQVQQQSSRFFSQSLSSLDAQVLSGTELAKKVRSEAHDSIIKMQKTYPNFKPTLSIIQVGTRPDSTAYVRMKLKASTSSGVNCEVIKFDENTPEVTILNKIKELNDDVSVHGVLVQLPLPKHMDEVKVTNSVITEKDVDGFDRYNTGELAKRGACRCHW
ncbi:unnamed protein product [Ambrosiozyma monospora]|uniref:methenyltetrahydrofolate cyclohydrolase n=1 Tax=Ambrosiozyma monospora TaxID=43982 RepID=A0A9W7DPF0_AMBMO|nr:unnamed protein product [Ambrosiozyma monospora]